MRWLVRLIDLAIAAPAWVWPVGFFALCVIVGLFDGRPWVPIVDDGYSPRY